MTYDELITKANSCRTKQRKHQIKLVAKDKYPASFDEYDFKVKKKFNYMQYDELKELYNNEDLTTSDQRGNVKRYAMKFQQYTDDDFPRKSKSDNWTYETYVTNFNKLSTNKSTHSTNVSRYMYKIRAKKRYPDQFDATDFPKIQSGRKCKQLT